MRAHRSDIVPVELMPIRFAIVLSREALQVLSQERLFGAIHLLHAGSSNCLSMTSQLNFFMLPSLPKDRHDHGFEKYAENEFAMLCLKLWTHVLLHILIYFSFPRAKLIAKQTNGEVFLICEKNSQKDARNYGKRSVSPTAKSTTQPIERLTMYSHPDWQCGEL